MNIVFLGPPGSGKGTQAKRVVDTYNLAYIATGDLFRDAIANQTGLGKEIRAFLESGRLVPDEMVSQVVFEKLVKLKHSNGFLLDGYPRTLDQAKALDEFGNREKVGIGVVIFFQVDGAELVKRLSSRRHCPHCKEVYNLETRPPKRAGVCDLCSNALVQREDDREDVVQNRIRIYEAQTVPVKDFYSSRPGFSSVNGAQDIQQVYNEVAFLLQNRVSKAG